MSTIALKSFKYTKKLGNTLNKENFETIIFAAIKEGEQYFFQKKNENKLRSKNILHSLQLSIYLK